MNPLSGTLLLLTAGCFICVLACYVADEWLPRWFGKRDERWTNYEDRCGVNESCILRENHRGPHEEKDFD